jgi:hypothetical protein
VDAFELGNLNLNLLTGYRLMREWDAHLNIITVIKDESERLAAERFLRELCSLARFPQRVSRLVLNGDFETVLTEAPEADVNVFGIPAEPDFDYLTEWIDRTRSTVIFVKDSGRESALV